MNDRKKGSVLVFSRDEQIRGIFTERDFVNTLVSKDPAVDLISTVMTPASKLLTATPEWSLRKCQEVMTANRIRHLPILDNKSKTAGIISRSDIIQYLAANNEIYFAPKLFGENMREVNERSKEVANLLALEKGEEGRKQDLLRTGFVVTAGVFLSAILQAGWVHDHETVAMIGTFLLVLTRFY